MKRVSKKALAMISLALVLSFTALADGIFNIPSDLCKPGYNPCKNEGIFIKIEEYMTSEGFMAFHAICVCPAGFTGYFCEIS